jgi:CubicO group peptidase (beta-lactamase class C family)
LLSLDSWAKRWVPEDPALAQRDISVITFWLSHDVDADQLPVRQVVVAFELSGPRAQQQWLVLERGAPASICVEDPGLPQDRYVYVEAEAATLYSISRGLRNWGTALADGSVRVYGEPKLVKALPGWFRRHAPEREPVAGGQTLTPLSVHQPTVL